MRQVGVGIRELPGMGVIAVTGLLDFVEGVDRGCRDLLSVARSAVARQVPPYPLDDLRCQTAVLGLFWEGASDFMVDVEPSAWIGAA